MKGSFMSSSMGNLAANGIINFDPDAYVMNGISRAMAEDDVSLPFDKPLYASPYVPYRVAYVNPGQPHRDMYMSNHESRGISWTELLAGLLVGGAATYGGFKLLEKKEGANTATAATAEKKGLWVKTKDFAKKCKDKVVSWFKKTKDVSETEKAIREAAKDPAKAPKGIFNKYSKWKIAGIAAAGVVALYAIYKAFSSRRQHDE